MRISDWSSDVCSSDLLQPIVEDASRDLTPLPRTGAVSQEVALAIGAALLCLLKTETFLAGREPVGEDLEPGMAGIDDAFELRGGQQAFRDGALREHAQIDCNRRRTPPHPPRYLATLTISTRLSAHP